MLPTGGGGRRLAPSARFQRLLFRKRLSTRILAFTLAEVLITLGIIGVIAAMTVPTLISNHQKQSITTNYKRLYSIFSQALLHSQIDNGPLENWDFSDLNLFETNIVPYLKVIKNCGKRKNEGCYPPDFTYKNMAGIKGSSTADNSSNYKLWLADGTIISVWSGTTCVTDPTANCWQIWVDTNGLHGPNKTGYDKLSFVVYSKLNEIVPTGMKKYNSETGKYELTEDDKTAIYENCTPLNDSSTAGYSCPARIILDDYKIKY